MGLCWILCLAAGLGLWLPVDSYKIYLFYRVLTLCLYITEGVLRDENSAIYDRDDC